MAARRKTAENGTRHHESKRQKRSKDRGPTILQPPLMPMIDVVFLLLIFFFLACQFRMTEGQIQADLPNVAGPQVSPPLKLTPIRITLVPTNDGEGVAIEIGDRVGQNAITDPLELYGKLKSLQDTYQSKDVPVIIKPMGRVRWAFVVETFNQAVRAEFKNIAFAPADA